MFDSVLLSDELQFIIGLFEGDSEDLDSQLKILKQSSNMLKKRNDYVLLWIDSECHQEILETLNRKPDLPSVISFDPSSS